MAKVALVVGGANCVFDDLKKALDMFDISTIAAVNDIVTKLPVVNHACSMHPDKLEEWLYVREKLGLPAPDSVWTAHDRDFPSGIPFRQIRNTHGGSGLLAVYILKGLGYKKIVLCGVPMTAENGHYFNPDYWNECILYRVNWEKRSHAIQNVVRSFSGWTKETFGEPTTAWAEQPSQASQ